MNTQLLIYEDNKNLKLITTHKPNEHQIYSFIEVEIKIIYNYLKIIF